MKKKEEIVIYKTDDKECLCHACALIIFKTGKEIPQGEKVTGNKKCDICGYKIRRLP